jgi:hypothetical protein
MMEKRMNKRVVTLGSLIDRMSELREQRRVLGEEDKKLKAEYDAIELDLIASLDQQGMVKGTGRVAGASIGENVVANKVDFMATMAWIAKTKNYQLVQQRISDPAYRELRALGKTIPGLEDFTKRSINLRNL